MNWKHLQQGFLHFSITFDGQKLHFSMINVKTTLLKLWRYYVKYRVLRFFFVSLRPKYHRYGWKFSYSRRQNRLSQWWDSCIGGKVVGLFQKWYDFSESGTTFSCINRSHMRERLTRHRDRLIRKKERLIQRLVGLSRARAHAFAPRERFFKK